MYVIVVHVKILNVNVLRNVNVKSRFHVKVFKNGCFAKFSVRKCSFFCRRGRIFSVISEDSMYSCGYFFTPGESPADLQQQFRSPTDRMQPTCTSF